jgi:hypothetical protein
MVIAPLLGPNVALALATTLGDIPLARNAAKTNIIGIATALGFSVILGFIVRSSPDISRLPLRQKYGWTALSWLLPRAVPERWHLPQAFQLFLSVSW